jgi:TolB-like protein
MIYAFDTFELDTGKAELRESGIPLAVEPQVFQLLVLLAENAHRLVSREEIIANIWAGRVVSDSAISSRIKSARKALGDDGAAQRFIKTVHGRGLRFVGVVERRECPLEPLVRTVAAGVSADSTVTVAAPCSQPSIAILPLRLLGDSEPLTLIARALPYDLIAELSRLRWLFVIAHGSSFRFHSDDDTRAVGNKLGVRYCLTGSAETLGSRMGLAFELADTCTGGVLWSNRYECSDVDVHEVRAQIVAGIITMLEIQITAHEARMARLSAPDSLDAWAHYHLGLQQMYRFNAQGNAAATHLFEQAVALEPEFARAHAGLSFTCFQNAFLQYSADPRTSMKLARQHAEAALERDSLDPFVNFNMGRSFWLEGELEQSLGWLERATELSPSYAQGLYSRAWADTISGRAVQGQATVDRAILLSPMDPLRYGMLGTRAFAHSIQGQDGEAAAWAEKAAQAPGAHVLIEMIAALAHQLNGNGAAAKRWTTSVRRKNAHLGLRDFFRAFPFQDPATRQRFSAALRQCGFAD